MRLLTSIDIRQVASSYCIWYGPYAINCNENHKGLPFGHSKYDHSPHLNSINRQEQTITAEYVTTELMVRRITRLTELLRTIETCYATSVETIFRLYSFYRASICEGGLGSRNSVCPSGRLSHAWIVTTK